MLGVHFGNCIPWPIIQTSLDSPRSDSNSHPPRPESNEPGTKLREGRCSSLMTQPYALLLSIKDSVRRLAHCGCAGLFALVRPNSRERANSLCNIKSLDPGRNPTSLKTIELDAKTKNDRPKSNRQRKALKPDSLNQEHQASTQTPNPRQLKNHYLHFTCQTLNSKPFNPAAWTRTLRLQVE